jgi:hypothetical protein
MSKTVIVSFASRDAKILLDVKEWIQISNRRAIHRFVDAVLNGYKILFTDYKIQSHLRNLFQCSGEVIEKRYSLPLRETIQHLLGKFLASRDLYHLARTSKQQGAVFGMDYWQCRLMEEMKLPIDDFKETTLPPECRYWRVGKSLQLIAKDRQYRESDRLYFLATRENDRKACAEIRKRGITEFNDYDVYYDLAFELGKLAHLSPMKEHFAIQEMVKHFWRDDYITGELNSMLMGLGYAGDEKTIMSLLRVHDEYDEHDSLVTMVIDHGSLDFLWEGVVKGRRADLYRTLKAYDGKRFNDTQALIVAIRENHQQEETTLLDSKPDVMITDLKFILDQPDLKIDQKALDRDFDPQRLDHPVVEFLKGYRQYFSAIFDLSDDE